MWGFGARTKIIEKIGKIVFEVMDSVVSPLSSTANFSVSTSPLAGVKRSLRPSQAIFSPNSSSYQNYLS